MRKNRKTARSSMALFLVLTLMLQAVIFQVGAVSAFAEEAITKVTKLQVEYSTNPVGIDVTNPRFSWQLESEAIGIMQTSYRIVVADSEEKLASEEYVWDTGVVASDNSIGIKYVGPALTAATRYFWTVFVEVNKGSVTNDEVAYWETGLMGKKIASWSGAKWIGIPAATTGTDINTYTIDYDFKIVKDSAGFTFAATGVETSMLMWQFNIADFKDGSGNPIAYFRPHRWGSGPNPIAQINISNVMPLEKQHDWWHVTIKASRNGTTNKIETYLGPIGGDATLIHTYTVTAASGINLGKIGMRQTADANVTEIGEFDNFVIKNSSGDVIFSEDFSNETALRIFTGGTITPNGTLHVQKANFICPTNITSPYKGGPTSLANPLLRKSVNISKDIKSARLYATARGIYEFSINGEKVGNDYLAPGWTDYFYNFQYQTYDVTDMLNTGANAIGAMIGKGWFSSNTSTIGPDYYKNISLGQALLAKLVITYADGTSDTIVTDTTWKFADGPIIFCDNYDGETYDARMEIPGWNTASFDDSSWKAAATIADLSSSININAQIGPSVQQIDMLRPISVTEPQPGLFTYDFGQNMVGMPRIKFKGEAGQKVRIRYAEMINTENANNKVGNGDGPAGTLYVAALRSAKATDYYTLKGDPNGEIYMPTFTYHGFRYMEISGVAEAVPVEDIEGIVIASNNEVTGDFETSAPKVNKLYSNIVWGQRGNFVSIPTDCPQRDERLGWTGDTQVFARTATYIQNSNQFYYKWLQDLRSWQSANSGRVPDVVPQVHVSGSANGWGDAAVIVPWQIYQQYGDVGVINDSYSSMKSWVNYLNTNSTNFIRPAGGYGDWLAPAGTPTDITNTLYTAYVNKLFAKMAGVVGNTADEATYTTRYNNIMNAFLARYTKADGSLTVNTQTPYAMLLYFNMLPEGKVSQYAKNLKDNIMNNDYHLSTGFVGISYLAPSLTENGYIDAAYRLLEQETYPSWIYSINNGATTLWERWNSFTLDKGFGDVGMNSFNHYSFGSIGEWMYSGILGIQRDEANPGYKNFFLNPMPGGSLTYAKGHFDSVYGRINSSWKLEDGLFKYDCTIPANTTATVYLPISNINDLVGSLPEGAVYTGEVVKGRIAIEVGSGSYHFEVPYDSGFGKVKYISIDNPQGIDAVININGVEYPLPFRNEIPASVKEISVESKDPNYAFAYWTGDFLSVYNPVTEVKDGLKLSANFKNVATGATDETVTFAVSGLNNGASVIVGEEKITSDGNITLDKGTEVVVDVIPPSRERMMGWASGDGNTKLLSNPGLVVMNGDISLKPIFEAPIQYENYAKGKSITTNDSMEASGWSVNNLVNGNRSSTPWTSNKSYTNGIATTPVTIEIDLGANQTFSRVTLCPRVDGASFEADAHYFPRDFKVYAKADGQSSWGEPIITVVDHPDSSVPVDFDFSAINARYIRFELTRTAEKRTSGDMYRFQLAEIEISARVPYSGNPVTSIDINSTAKAIKPGETVKLTATCNPANADQKGVTWFIREVGKGDNPFGLLSDKGIGVISGNSIEFTALKTGAVEIVAYANDKFGAIGHYRLNIVDGVAMTTVPETIVAGKAANVKVIVDMDTAPSANGLTVELFGVSAPVVDGEAIIKLPASAVVEDASATVNAIYNGENVGFCTINVKADAFATTATASDDGAVISFNTAIAGKSGKFMVYVNGALAEYTFDAAQNAITVPSAVAGDKVVIKNVQLTELYPSFYFTFTVDVK